MIREVRVEKMLRHWDPWINIIREMKSYFEVKRYNHEILWSHSAAILKDLDLPAKPLLRLYFLSCVFSDYIYKNTYSFDSIQLPYCLLKKLEYFERSARILRASDMVADFMGNSHFRYRPDLELLRKRPLPPARWTKGDISFALEWINDHPFTFDMSIFEMLRQSYGPYFIVLSPKHPLCKIVTKIKRGINTDTAIACAEMKDQGHTYREIAEKFGWALQQNDYGKPVRSSTARRYVQRGRRLKNHG